MTSTKTPDPLRILVGLMVSVLLLMGSAQMTGCASTPEDPNGYKAFVIAGEARATAIKTLAVLNDAGLIDPSSYEDIDAAVSLTGAALRMWKDALDSGDDPTESENLFYDNFETFRKIQKEAERPREPNA